MKVLGKCIALGSLFCILANSLFASRMLENPLLSFEIPSIMELRIENRSQIQMVFSTTKSQSQTYTLQPKGTGARTPSATIKLTMETKQRPLTNVEFKEQSLASSAQNISEASRTLEMSERRKQEITSWGGLSFTEVGGQFAWKYHYLRTDSVQVETYIIHKAQYLLSIEMTYRISERSRWKPIFDHFISSQITFKSSLEEPTVRTRILAPLVTAQIPFSEKTFLWHTAPQWKRGITTIPNRRGYYIYTLTTENDLLQTEGYYFKISVGEGLPSQTGSLAARRTYLLQAQMDILKTLENNPSLIGFQLEGNARDETLQAVLVRYSYTSQATNQRINGALAVKITNDRKPLHIETEWWETGAARAEQILSSLLFE